MRYILLWLSAVAVCLPQANESRVKEPAPYTKGLMHWQRPDGRLIRLPQEQDKVEHGWIAGAHEVAGRRCGLRIKTGEPLVFVKRLGPGRDAFLRGQSGIYEVTKYEIGSNSRRVTMQGRYFDRRKFEISYTFDVRPFGEYSAKFSLTENLPPGEYAVIPTDPRQDLYCFAIDP